MSEHWPNRPPPPPGAPGQQPYGQYADAYGQDQPHVGPGFGPGKPAGFDPTRPIGSSGDPTQPIGTGRDTQHPTGAPAQQPMLTPPRPPQSKLPVILVSAVVALALIGLVIGAVVAVRSDISQGKEPSTPPSVQETAVPLPENQARFETLNCKNGLLEVLNHERTSYSVRVQLQVTCSEGEQDVEANMFALFDKDTQDYYNSPPTDRDPITYGVASPGNAVSGWTEFMGVPEGTVTLLMLDPGQQRTAAAVTIKG